MTPRSGGLEAMLAGSVLEVAPRLLGATVQTEVDGRTTAVMLTEVEAYMGADDPASHAYGGETPRNGSMFGEAGTLYVYRSYGIHWCMNVVVGEPGIPHAILLRGGRPIRGIDVIEERRGRGDHLADGPGKLCQALAVTGAADGSNVFEGPVVVGPGRLPGGVAIQTTTRVGISRAVDLPWRWVVTG
jgi:DNA-3-methyladenine glycosylase